MWGTNKKYFGFRACKDLLQLFIIWAHFKDEKILKTKYLAQVDDFEDYSPRKPETVEEKKKY